MPRALVVIATYNQRPSLRLALRGFLRQTTSDFHLCVADDGSSDGTAACIEELRPVFMAGGIGLGHVWHADEGFRKCRILNEAIRQSPVTPLVIFTDGDCLPPAAFVEKHLAVHEPMSLHVGGAWRLTQDQGRGIDEACVEAGRFEGLRNEASRRDIARKRRKSGWGTRLGRRHRPKILGLNFALDRRLLEALNGFDERFESWGLGEDSDIRDRAMRLRPKPRVKVLYGTNDVIHLWHPTNRSALLAESRRYAVTARPIRCVEGLSGPEGD